MPAGCASKSTPKTTNHVTHTAGIEVIVDLLADGTVRLARRKDAVQLGNAKRSDVRKILNAAAEYFEVIVVAWMEMHR